MPGAPETNDSRLAGRRRPWTQGLQIAGPLLALAGLYAVFAAIGPASFRSLGNLETILRQTAIVGAAALGMTIIMIAGGIDLSVGSVVALATVVIAWLRQYGHWPESAAAFAGLATGALCGFFSGLLITQLRVLPFIVTLGMMLMARGLAKAVAHSQKIDAPTHVLPKLTASLPESQRFWLFPPGVWLVIFCAVLLVLALRTLRYGRHLFAVGSNELTARLCGVAVERLKVITYTLGGASFGLAGLLLFSRLTVGDPTAAVGLELDVIAAVVIGGGSLSGGEGSVFGSLVGALIMSVIASGCSQLGLENWVQELLTGAIIVVAVAIDRWRQHERRWG